MRQSQVMRMMRRTKPLQGTDWSGTMTCDTNNGTQGTGVLCSFMFKSLYCARDLLV